MRSNVASEQTVKIQHIAMAVPTAEFIYAPSNRPVREISYDEFLQRFTNSARVVQVSFEQDCKSNPQSVTAYANGLDCWYIVV